MKWFKALPLACIMFYPYQRCEPSPSQDPQFNTEALAPIALGSHSLRRFISKSLLVSLTFGRLLQANDTEDKQAIDKYIAQELKLYRLTQKDLNLRPQIEALLKHGITTLDLMKSETYGEHPESEAVQKIALLLKAPYNKEYVELNREFHRSLRARFEISMYHAKHFGKMTAAMVNIYTIYTTESDRFLAQAAFMLCPSPSYHAEKQMLGPDLNYVYRPIVYLKDILYGGQRLADDSSVSVEELSSEKSHEKMIEILAHNYHITLLAQSIIHDDSGRLMLRDLKGAEAINELNKRLGVQGITRQGIAELNAMFRRELFETLVEMLVAKSTEGYTAEDFERVNEEVSPYGIHLQDFGIHPPKKQKKHFGINLRNQEPHSFELLGYAA